jgi:hypothetical protein
MPNRIIKESICDSEKLAALSDFEFRLWVGLITQADDAGRGDARPAYIKGHVFPFRERVTTKDIDAALHALAAGSCVTLYTVGGRPYYSFPSWAKHQRIRDCKPKYPGPEDADLPQSAADCGDLPHAAADCGGLRPESNPNPIQSESNPKYIGTEPQAASMPPVIFLPLNDGAEYPVSQEQCHEWAGLYPAVDVIQQLRQMRAWLIANPRKKKTKSGINRFIVTWLSKEQDRGGVYGKEESRGQQGKPEYRNVGRDL